jgi:DNA-binding SARP family transcriptional activator/tetratricopeptide (TPR) repeat protein
MPDRSAQLGEADFRLLGPLEVRICGAEVAVRPGKQRAVLAALLLSANHVVTTQELITALWGSFPPASAAVTVRNYVKRLRAALGDHGRGRIVTHPAGYLITLDESSLDVARFERLLDKARAAARDGKFEAAAAAASAALELWRGEPLADVNADPLLLRHGTRLAELRLLAQETRIDARLKLGGHADVIPELRQLVDAHPLRERLHGMLMLALYQDGQQAAALSCFLDARRALVEQLGAEPGAELRALHLQILRADPSPLAGQGAAHQRGAAEPPASSAADSAGTLDRAAARPTPRQLPAAAGFFAGRKAELAELSGLLDISQARVPVVLIAAIGGTAGVGKTALAVQWAHQVAARFPDGQLYVNLRGYDADPPMSAAGALAGFLTAMGVPEPQLPAETHGRAALYRSLLADRRMLIVLDNAREPEQVRPLLPGAASCLTVVTSRDTLAGLVARDGATRLDLDVLTSGEAVALLRDLIGPRVSAEPKAARQLTDLCCRLPLALRVAAELAVSRPGQSLTALAAELDGVDRLDQLNAGGDRETAVRAVFSWSYRNLSPDAARTFRLAGLQPGTDFSASAVAATTGGSDECARRALAELTRAHLLWRDAANRYSMHDLLRAYAAELAVAQDDAANRREALTRLLDYYLNNAGAAAGILFPAEAAASTGPLDGAPGMVPGDEQAARAWLDAERANLTAAATFASGHGWPGHASGLSTRLVRYLDAGGFFTDALAIHRAAAQAALQAGDRAAEAAAVNNIATVYLNLGRNKDAEQYLKRVLELSREAGDSLSELRALLNLSQLYLFVGAYPDAAASCQRALELSRATGNRLREARALGILGLIAIRQGRYRQAAEGLIDAVEASRAAGDLTFLSLTLANLGEAEVRRGRYAEGREHLAEAQATARQAGHARAEASVVRTLGLADLREGLHQQAARRLQQALTAFRDAGVSSNEAEVLCLLGELDLCQGRPAQAADRYQQALAIYRRIAEPAGEADARNGLGEAALAQGALEDARTHHDAALAIAAEVASPEQVARAHEGIGNVSAAANHAAEARSHWAEALAQYAELEAPCADRVRARLDKALSTQS